MPVLTFVLFLCNCAILTSSSMCWKNSVTFAHADLRLSQTMYHVRVVVFWVTCKGKLKSVWVIAVDTNSSVSQSDFKCNTCNRSKARERPSFRFASDWLINWHVIFSLCNHLAVLKQVQFWNYLRHSRQKKRSDVSAYQKDLLKLPFFIEYLWLKRQTWTTDVCLSSILYLLIFWWYKLARLIFSKILFLHYINNIGMLLGRLIYCSAKNGVVVIDIFLAWDIFNGHSLLFRQSYFYWVKVCTSHGL